MDHEGNPLRTREVGDTVAGRRMRELDRAEALRLLSTVSLGRIVFTQHALPAVRPVNHLVEGEDIVVRIHGGGALASLAAPAEVSGVVVAYEADVIDPVTQVIAMASPRRGRLERHPPGRTEQFVGSGQTHSA
ncbi:pyridoxamine 5'-phosphate oxidase family protein [Streptomyces sp. NPDC001193]